MSHERPDRSDSARPESDAGPQSGFRKQARPHDPHAPAAPAAADGRYAPRIGPKPEYANLWQLLRERPAEGLRWLLRGGEHANYFRSPVHWLFGRDLLVHLRSIALYSGFGDELDHRDWMQTEVQDLRELPCDEGGFWFDYVADTGDGQLAMYNVASLIVSDLYLSDTAGDSPGDATLQLEAQNPNATRLPRGRCLFFGGDTAYHVADTATLETNLSTPFAWAIQEARARGVEASGPRYAFGIPGNHDYYDSLIGFNRLFRAETPLLPLADYDRVQRASFVALRLPFDFLFLGLDCQNGKLDRRQRRFMQQCLSAYGSERLIVATPEPTTVFDSIEARATQPFADLALPRPFTAAPAQFPAPEQVQLDLSGDVHHYVRYASDEHPNYASVVAGGGGAFVHPSHTSHRESGAAWPPPAAAHYPAPDDSRRLITSRLLCPWRILSGGGVFLLGGLFAVLMYLGVALSPELRQRLVLERATNNTWELGSAVAKNLGRVLDRHGRGAALRMQLTPEEWLTILALAAVILLASITSPKLFAQATMRDENARKPVYAGRYGPLCAAALACLAIMGITYYRLSGAGAGPLWPFVANFLLFAYLAPFPLALLWTAAYLATQAKQAKVRVMQAIDSLPRWIVLGFGVGSAVFGLATYGVNSVAAFATDLAALSAFGAVAIVPMIFGYQQGAGRHLRHKLGYAALGALFGLFQLALPLGLAIYGSAWRGVLAASLATAIGFGAYQVQRRASSAWLTLGLWLLAGVASLSVTIAAPSLRTVDGASFALAFLAGGSFACIWFGFYLAVSLGFGAHNNEAGGAARADHYRHFVRFKLERDRLTGYVIGFDKPSPSVSANTAKDTAFAPLQPRLVDRFTLTAKPRG